MNVSKLQPFGTETIDLPYHQDCAVYALTVKPLGRLAWLDSGRSQDYGGRHTIISAAPLKVFEFYQNPLESVGYEDYINYLRKLNEALEEGKPQACSDDGTHFDGGLIGVWGYDSGLLLNHVKPKPTTIQELPLCSHGLYSWAINVDMAAPTTP